MNFRPQAWVEYYRHRDEIADLLDPRCHTIEWLDAQLLSGDMLAFGAERAVIVVAIKKYPAGATELHGMVAAGDLGEILDLIAEAEKWARQTGVTFACIESRPGWAKILQKRGYYIHQIQIRKDLC